MKKFLAIVFAALLIVSVVPFAVSADTTHDWVKIVYEPTDETIAEQKAGDNLTWTLYYDSETYEYKLEISGTGPMYDFYDYTDTPWYELEDTEDSVYVSETDDSMWFYNGDAYLNPGITELQVDEGVTTIGSRAFEQFNYLKTISLPSSLKEIHSYAFNASILPSSTLDLPASLTSISSYAFASHSEITDVKINSDLTSIGNYAFANCIALTSINIPDSCTSIGSGAFMECTGLKTLDLPSALAYIGKKAFIKCTNIDDLVFPSTLKTIGDEAFKDCTTLSPVTLPEGLETIGKSAFYNCASLTEITVPASVTKIGNSAFAGCASLATAILNNDVLGDAMFQNDYSLSSVTMNGNNKVIAPKAFQNNISLTSITIPETVTNIGDTAFAGDIKLGSFTIPASVVNIGAYAFVNCKALSSITVPGTVEYIGDYAFGMNIDLGSSDYTAIASMQCLKSSAAYGYAVRNGITVISTFQSPVTATFLSAVMGDATGNDTTSAADVLKVRKSIIGLESLDETESFAADMNGDNVINIKDVLLMRRLLVDLY